MRGGELSEPLADLDLWQATSRYFSTAQAEESARSWVAEVDGEVVASATLALFVRPPYPGNLAGGRLSAQHVYPAGPPPAGAGRALLDQMADYAKAQQLGRVWLHASDEDARSMNGSVLWPIRLIWSGSPGDPRRALHVSGAGCTESPSPAVAKYRPNSDRTTVLN